MIHVVLVSPEIHWNAGNVGRSCLATGARLHLVEPLGFSLDDREVKRAGLDYWPRVAPTVWRDWPSFEQALPGLGSPWLFSARAPTDYWTVDLRADPVLVFGSESEGLPPSLLERYANRAVRLPMAQSPDGETAVRSLNLSSAVTVALYEVLRQRAHRPSG